MHLQNFTELTDEQAAHIVLDLETLSTRPDALVLSIGAVGLNKHGEILDDAQFHVLLSRAEQDSYRHTSLQTLAWWREQSNAAIEATLDAPHHTHHPTDFALDAFGRFIASWSDKKSVCIWGNGCSFDNVILASLYRDFHIPLPWEFRNDRDMRTITAIFPHLKAMPFEGIKHHAQHDAMHEAKQLSKAIAELQNKVHK